MLRKVGHLLIGLCRLIKRSPVLSTIALLVVTIHLWVLHGSWGVEIPTFAVKRSIQVRTVHADRLVTDHAQKRWTVPSQQNHCEEHRPPPLTHLDKVTAPSDCRYSIDLLKEAFDAVVLFKSQQEQSLQSGGVELPQPISPLSVESSVADADPVLTQLITMFQSELTLPEPGSVKVALTLSPSGEVTQCEILFSESEANGAYLRARLRELSFVSIITVLDREKSWILNFHADLPQSIYIEDIADHRNKD